MTRMWKAGLLLAAAVAVYQVRAGASGSAVPAPSAPPPASMPMMTPEEVARAAYNNGIEHKDKGQKLEQKAATETKDQQKNLAKAKSEYEKSLKDFKKAAELVPGLYQAYNGMGFAYRKTGDYVKALEMYDKALQLAPGFPDAVEYRGEAYLALNRLEDAKQAYLQLFASDRNQANLLMKAMTEWIGKRQADPGGVDAATISEFEAWVKERSTLAGQTAHMALTPEHVAWQ